MQDMTQGGIHGTLVRFTIPLVLGNLFQLAYNAADSVIVGRCVGKTALAAVGAANPIMNIAIFFVSGVCLGASVLMSEYFGAHRQDMLQREISTAMLAGLVFSLCLSAGGFFAAKPLLQLIQTPAAALSEATRYLQIILLGMAFTFLYNFYANTLRALGDSRTPLVFLTLSALFNIAADLFFVVVLHGGVMGCGVATVMAQALSCLACGLYIRLRVPLLRLGRRWFVFDASLLRRTVQYSWASAMQQTALYVGKVLVQAMLNGLGLEAAAAWNAVSRVDDFAFTPQQNIGHAMTTFLAQNRGAGNNLRVRKGFWAGLEISMCYTVFLSALCFCCAEPIMGLFTDDAEIIALGRLYLRITALLYFLPALTNTVQGFFRGMGKLQVTLWATAANMLGRVVTVWLLVSRIGFPSAALGNLGGWVVMLLFELPLFIHYYKQHLCCAPSLQPHDTAL